jgi:hypothetical protein
MQRPSDQEALSSEPVRVRSGQNRHEDAGCAIGRDDEAGGSRGYVELARDLREHGRHDDADVDRVEAEEAEEEEKLPTLAGAQVGGRARTKAAKSATLVTVGRLASRRNGRRSGLALAELAPR